VREFQTRKFGLFSDVIEFITDCIGWTKSRRCSHMFWIDIDRASCTSTPYQSTSFSLSLAFQITKGRCQKLGLLFHYLKPNIAQLLCSAEAVHRHVISLSFH